MQKLLDVLEKGKTVAFTHEKNVMKGIINEYDDVNLEWANITVTHINNTPCQNVKYGVDFGDDIKLFVIV